MSRKAVVFDTNCWISSYFSPRGVAGQATRIALERYTIAHSEETLAELTSVLSREKFAALAPFDERMKFCDNVAASGQITRPLYQFQIFDDPSDDKFFSLAYSAGADCIVSGDENHVRPLKHLYGIQIWSPAQFLAREKLLK